MAKIAPKIIDYRDQLRRLNEEGPACVYVLRGEEEFLRENFVLKLRERCLPEGTDSFNYTRLDGPAPDMRRLSDALESMPFLAERTLCEVRGFDINKTKDYDTALFSSLIADVPAWCTVVFIFPPDYAPDGRLAPVKALNKAALTVEFTRQSDRDLTRWLYKQFQQRGKSVDMETAEYMLYVCGTLMNALLPEIDKVAGYAKGERILISDIDAVAKKAPESTVFNLTDALGDGKFDEAALLLSNLLEDREENPHKLLYVISEQMRRLYAARLARDGRRTGEWLGECFPELGRQEFLRRKLMTAAGNFSAGALRSYVAACAECEFKMKNGGGVSDTELLKELLLTFSVAHA